MGKKKIKEQPKEEIPKEQDSQSIAAGRTDVSKKSKKIEKGKIYINVSYNNTLVTVTDENGNVLAWASSGSLGFSGPKKATPFASSKVIAAICEKLKNSGPKSVEVYMKGVGGGRDSALRSLINQGFNILSIKDVTPIPHNGPRPAKPRRV